ncbi:alpha/beta hydrolase [Halobacteriales archaeon QS_1_68_20]|nr:MAG: alpha/beta hydrolase [Halobacteriales archaeon QS_1_68_20]
METVSHRGRTTAYRLSDRGGGRPTVLFVHGSGGTHGAWKGQFRLSGEFPVAAVDLSGHGESTDVDADPGWGALSAYADDVLAVAETVDADVLVGNSLGGAVAMHVALERDADIDGLGLVGTGARLSVLEDLRVWLQEDFEQAVAFLHEPGKLFYDAPEEYVELSKEEMYETGQATTARDFLTCDGVDVRDRVGEIDLPALAVTGEHDKLTPPWYHEFLAEEMPSCDWTTIDDAAHLSMLERPEAFNETLSAFLTDLR